MLPSTFYHPDVGTSVHLDMRLGERNAILLSHQLFIIGKARPLAITKLSQLYLC